MIRFHDSVFRRCDYIYKYIYRWYDVCFSRYRTKLVMKSVYKIINCIRCYVYMYKVYVVVLQLWVVVCDFIMEYGGADLHF